MSINFLSILDESNSIKDETTGEITLISEKIETVNSYIIESSCKITSNCNTVISCSYFEILAPSVSLSNITFNSTVLAQETEKLIVTNCKFEDAKSGFSAFTISFCADVTISHIEITHSAKMPGLYICQSSTVTADHVHVHDVPYTLLACDGASHLVIKDSEFHKSEKNGVHVSDQSYIEITNCQISDTAYPGISVNDSQCIIKNNTLSNVGQNCISIFSSKEFIVENNSIRNCGATAISCERSHGIVNNNKMNEIHGNGVHVSNNADVHITNNEINDADYPGIAIVSNANATIKKNRICRIKINGICSRGAKNVHMEDTEIIDVEECGISISDTKRYEIEKCKLLNCKIMAIESYNNSQVFLKDNIISNVGKYVFLSYTNGFIKAENNKIDDVKIAMSKLVYKGGGEFVNNSIVNCPIQCECQTLSPYFFCDNGQFENVTNIKERASEKVKFVTVQVDSDNLMCMKCHKKPRNCFILECGHKVFCRECADEALNNHEKCPLCRFSIEKVYDGINASSDDLCTICFENKADCIILPCGHMGACAPCLEDWFKNKKSCPFCRAEPCFYKQIINDF